MRILTTTFLIAAFGALPSAFAGDLRAKTADGREVVLRDDGTWSFVEPAKPVGPAEGTKIVYEGKRGTFALRLNPGTWIKTDDPVNADAEVMFEHKDGDVYAMIIAERIAIPVESLKKIALAMLNESGADAKIIHEETRKLDGVDVLRVTLEVESDGILLTFFNSYYSGPSGSIQTITWTGKNLFDEMKPDMEKFLDGLVILKK